MNKHAPALLICLAFLSSAIQLASAASYYPQFPLIPTAIQTPTGYIISNLTALSYLSLGNLNITDNFIQPNGTGITVNGNSFLLQSGNLQSEAISKNQTAIVYASLLNVSWMPPVSTAEITLDMVPNITTTTVPFNYPKVNTSILIANQTMPPTNTSKSALIANNIISPANSSQINTHINLTNTSNPSAAKIQAINAVSQTSNQLDAMPASKHSNLSNYLGIIIVVIVAIVAAIGIKLYKSNSG